MAANVNRNAQGFPWRAAGWGGAAFLLLLPLIAGAPWTLSDYVFMAVLLGVVGLGLELVFRMSGSSSYRIAAGLALVAAFLTVWVNAAVGMIGDEDNAYNLWFLGVLVLALGGAVIVRFRARAMATAMALAGAAQLAASLIGMQTDVRGGIFSAVFTGFWLLSAALFRKAGEA